MSSARVERIMRLLGDTVLARIVSRMEAAEEEINKMYQEGVQEAYEAGLKKFSRIYERELQDLFRASVQEFYDSYTPKKYKRRYGLFDVSDFYVDDTVNVIGSAGESDDIISLFNEDLMHPDRSGGDSLFETVFVEGYHGGAKDGDGHPEPGVAWWKVPKRNTWYKPAYQTESPYEIFESGIEARADELQSKYTNTVQKSINEYAESFAKEIPEILRRLLKS